MGVGTWATWKPQGPRTFKTIFAEHVSDVCKRCFCSCITLRRPSPDAARRGRTRMASSSRRRTSTARGSAVRSSAPWSAPSPRPDAPASPVPDEGHRRVTQLSGGMVAEERDWTREKRGQEPPAHREAAPQDPPRASQGRLCWGVTPCPSGLCARLSRKAAITALRSTRRSVGPARLPHREQQTGQERRLHRSRPFCQERQPSLCVALCTVVK